MADERTLIAFFPSSTKAEQARQALASRGVDAEIKRNSRFGASSDPVINNALTGQAETLTGLTVYSTNVANEDNQNARVLMGADPSVSGFSSKGYGMAGGAAFTLVAFAPEDKVEQAVQIIKQNGGEI